MLLAARAIKDGNQAITLDINGAPHTGAYSDPGHRRRVARTSRSPSPTRRRIRSRPSSRRSRRPRSRCRPAATASTIDAHLLHARRQRGERHRGQAERALCGRAQGQPAEQLGRRACWSTISCRPASRSTIRGWSTAPTSRTSPGWRRPKRRISSSATTVSSRRSTGIRAPTASFTLAYVVRAVTPGTYAHPAASVEDMYRPQFSARTAIGRDGGQGALTMIDGAQPHSDLLARRAARSFIALAWGGLEWADRAFPPPIAVGRSPASR